MSSPKRKKQVNTPATLSGLLALAASAYNQRGNKAAWRLLHDSYGINPALYAAAYGRYPAWFMPYFQDGRTMPPKAQTAADVRALMALARLPIADAGQDDDGQAHGLYHRWQRGEISASQVPEHVAAVLRQKQRNRYEARIVLRDVQVAKTYKRTISIDTGGRKIDIDDCMADVTIRPIKARK